MVTSIRWIAWCPATVAMILAGVDLRLSPTTIPVALSTVTRESGDMNHTGAVGTSAPWLLKAWTEGVLTTPVVSRRGAATTTPRAGKERKSKQRSVAERARELSQAND